MKKTRDLKKAAAGTAAAASEVGQQAWEDAIEKASHVLADAQKRVGPYAKEAKTQAADFASKRLDAWEPHIKSALDKVSPAVDAAREKVTDDILPKLQDALHNAAEHPVAVEAAKRSEAALQAVKGELEPAKPKKKGFFRKFGKVVAVGAVVAGAVAAVRHFLTPKDDGWTAHEPSRAYVNNNATFTKDEAKVVSDEEAVDQADMTAEGAPAPETPIVSETDASKAFGEGSYVGDNPPEGFAIKGNERSKKYHVPGGNGYDRTIAEVWFASEEAAEAAGFTKAQR